jgi:hypothetical protein
VFCVLTIYYSRDQIKWNKMGAPCNTHGERRGAQDIGGETRVKESPWKN